MTQINQIADYPLTIIATNIGQPPEGVKCSVSLLIDGVPINAAQQSSEQHILKMMIPNTVLSPKFDQHNLKVLDCAFNIKYSHKVFLGWSDFNHTYTFKITLMPIIAGSATFSGSYPVYGWNDGGIDYTPDKVTDDHDQTGNSNPTQFSYQVGPLAVDDNHCVKNASVNRGGMGGPWSRVDPVRYSSPSPHDANAYKQVEAILWVWGRPVTYNLQAGIQEWGVVRTQNFSYPIVFKYGDVAPIDLPQGATMGILEGMLSTKQTFKTMWPDPDAQSPVQIDHKEDLPGGGVRLWYLVPKPKLD